MWSIPYGESDDELGIIRRREGHELLVPAALTALPGGSFAVLDPVKQRLVLVDSGGVVGRSVATVPQVASDVAWDPVGERLIAIGNESKGSLVEVRLPDQVAEVTLNRPVSRLLQSSAGVFEYGANGYREKDGITAVPDPLGQYRSSGTSSLLLEDGSAVTFSSNRDGDRWVIGRSDGWSLTLRFAGVNGPAEPALSLEDDVVEQDGYLYIAAKVGAYVTTTAKPVLLVMKIDLGTGAVVKSEIVRECGLSSDSNVVSRITVDEGGTLYQACAGPRAAAEKGQRGFLRGSILT
ncbi:hypothetical protein [Nocardioides sp.]|uniref:hypothetical protein n=1 Tax=Nocardioides sp. TaxID=35761 RepID=UPI0039E50869